MTGATLLVAGACMSNTGTLTFSDSSTNTWTKLTQLTTGLYGQLAYVNSNTPTVTSSQTFSVNGAGLTPTIWVMGFNNTAASPYDQDTRFGSAANASTIQPGSITPAQAGEVFFDIVCTGNTGVTGFTINDSFTEMDYYGYAGGGSGYGGQSGYLVLSGSGATNPTWTANVGNNWLGALQATFKP
jgi:hypothetical protein